MKRPWEKYLKKKKGKTIFFQLSTITTTSNKICAPTEVKIVHYFGLNYLFKHILCDISPD